MSRAVKPFENENWTFIEEIPERKNKCIQWKCQCSCGNIFISPAHSLAKGRTKSCGCGRGTARYKHGRTRDCPTYRSWTKMHSRSGTEQWYKNIKVCERWKDFENFLADMGERPEGCTIDRIDPSGDYEPSNARWSTPTVQSYNRKVSANSKSGRSGVRWNKEKNKWFASISKNRKWKFLGYFNNIEDAIEARKKAELELYGEYSIKE